MPGMTRPATAPEEKHAGITQHGKTVTVQGYPARSGYGLVTGVGTINGTCFVPELARTG